MRDEAAAIEFRQDAVDAELVLQGPQPFGHLVRRADQHLAGQRLLIGQIFDPLEPLGPAFDRPSAGAAQGIPEPLRLLAVEMHQAFPRLLARPLLGLGDIGRDPQIDLSPARVAGCRIGLAIGADLRGEFGKGAVAGVDEDRQAALADRGIGVRAGRGDADRRVRLLQRLRRHRDVLEVIVLAVVGEIRLRPRQLDDIQNFGEAVAAFRIGDAVILVGARQTAAADAEDQPSAADVIDRRRLLGEAQRMAQWQYLDGDADLDPLGARSDRGGNAERRR